MGIIMGAETPISCPKIIEGLTKNGPIPTVFLELWSKHGATPFYPSSKLLEWQDLNQWCGVQKKRLKIVSLIAIILIGVTSFLALMLGWLALQITAAIVFLVGTPTIVLLNRRRSRTEWRMRGLEGQMEVFLEFLERLSVLLGFNGDLSLLVAHDSLELLQRFAHDRLICLAKRQIRVEKELEGLNRTDKYAIRRKAEDAIDIEESFKFHLRCLKMDGLVTGESADFLRSARNRLDDEAKAAVANK